MNEKIVIEFEVYDADQFKRSLQTWDSTADNCCHGYRIDEGVSKREALRKFCDQMELKLRKNDHKTSWNDLPIEALFRLMTLEIEEFKIALRFMTVREAMKELPDVANFAMMLYDRLSASPDATPDEFLRIEV